MGAEKQKFYENDPFNRMLEAGGREYFSEFGRVLERPGSTEYLIQLDYQRKRVAFHLAVELTAEPTNTTRIAGLFESLLLIGELQAQTVQKYGN